MLNRAQHYQTGAMGWLFCLCVAALLFFRRTAKLHPLWHFISGIAVYSARAEPLAAWMNGLEIAAISADLDRGCLILDSGVNERYVYGAYGRSEESTAEAQAWEMAKEATRLELGCL